MNEQMTFDEVLTEPPEEEGDDQAAKEGTDETSVKEGDLIDIDSEDDDDDDE